MDVHVHWNFTLYIEQHRQVEVNELDSNNSILHVHTTLINILVQTTCYNNNKYKIHIVNYMSTFTDYGTKLLILSNTGQTNRRI